MATVMAVFSFLVANWDVILAALVSILGGAFVIACLVPGEHPDKELDAIVNFLKKFSRK